MRRLWKLEKARACAPLEPLKRLALPTPGFTPPCGLSQTPAQKSPDTPGSPEGNTEGAESLHLSRYHGNMWGWRFRLKGWSWM